MKTTRQVEVHPLSLGGKLQRGREMAGRLIMLLGEESADESLWVASLRKGLEQLVPLSDDRLEERLTLYEDLADILQNWIQGARCPDLFQATYYGYRAPGTGRCDETSDCQSANGGIGDLPSSVGDICARCVVAYGVARGE